MEKGPSDGGSRTVSRNSLNPKSPLPPIGGKGDYVTDDKVESDSAGEESEDNEVDQVDEEIEDDKSTISHASSASLDRPGEGSARPAIIRGFRREMSSEMSPGPEKDRDEPPEGSSAQQRRSVSFSASSSVKQREKSMATKESARRTTYDGREITFITLDTQTDWNWVEEASTAGNVRLLEPSEKKADSRASGISSKGSMTYRDGSRSSSGRSTLGKESRLGESRPKSEGSTTPGLDTSRDVPPYQFPSINDEYGIPILEQLTSDSDDSLDGDDSYRRYDDRNFMPSIGPPQILQYIRESEKQEMQVDDPSLRLPEEVDTGEQEIDFPVDEYGKPVGMFGGVCEFCAQEVKAFPTVEDQERLPPEQLFCCNEYREFVEYAMNTAKQFEDDHKAKNKFISVKVHPHYGSKKDRAEAKRKAAERMREREMHRRQQESVGMQQQANFFASRENTEIREIQKIHNIQPSRVVKSRNDFLDNEDINEDIDDKPLLESVARQMKTINYQLSSQKCLEEGWTLRAPSPLLPEDHDDIFVPEPLNAAMIASGEFRDRPIIEKYYEDGQKFLTLFPDGTGNVFYPSGTLAVSVSSVVLGQYTYVVQEDTERARVLAVFEPNGFASCYHQTGIVRLYMDQIGGVELDPLGAKKRKWTWKDTVTHVHAPPFQPITFGLNKHIGVRIMAQDHMTITLSANQRSCRFNVGARLKLVAPSNIPPPEIDDNLIYLDEKKIRVETLLDKVSTLLKFPKSPKIDKILPPLHISSKMYKNEKMKKEKAEQVAAAQAKKNKQTPIVGVS